MAISDSAVKNALQQSAGSQTAQLLKLLEVYGPAALRRAVNEALERNTPRASSVAFLLRRQQRSAPAPMAFDLSRHPEVQAIEARPPDLETYDELARNDNSEQSSITIGLIALVGVSAQRGPIWFLMYYWYAGYSAFQPRLPGVL